MITRLMAFVLAFGVAQQTSAARPLKGLLDYWPAGIFQIIEKRAGRTSCRGVVIQLRGMRFKRSVAADQIRIIEGKYGRDLSALMSLRVTPDGKRLVIRFKPGLGDFGTGNVVQVEIERSAFVAPIQSVNLKFSWSISTDIL